MCAGKHTGASHRGQCTSVSRRCAESELRDRRKFHAAWKSFAESCGKKLYGTVPCTRPPGLFSFLDETPHPCHSDARPLVIPTPKLSTLVIPTPKGGGICGTTTLLPNRFCDAVNEEAGVPARQTSKTPASPPACKSVH